MQCAASQSPSTFPGNQAPPPRSTREWGFRGLTTRHAFTAHAPALSPASVMPRRPAARAGRTGSARVPPQRHVGERVVEVVERVLALAHVHLSDVARGVVLDDDRRAAGSPAPQHQDVGASGVRDASSFGFASNVRRWRRIYGGPPLAPRLVSGPSGSPFLRPPREATGQARAKVRVILEGVGGGRWQALRGERQLPAQLRDVGRPIGAERCKEVALTVDEPCQEVLSPTVDLDDRGGVRSADELRRRPNWSEQKNAGCGVAARGRRSGARPRWPRRRRSSSGRDLRSRRRTRGSGRLRPVRGRARAAARRRCRRARRHSGVRRRR